MTLVQTVNAFATTAIALLAVAIAGMQWWTAREKLILDLFGKRFQVFLDVRCVASEAIQLGSLKDPGLANEIIARGRFLFGDDLNQSLVKLHSLITKLEVKEPQAPHEINNHFNAMLPLFEPYLRMPQKMPRFWGL